MSINKLFYFLAALLTFNTLSATSGHVLVSVAPYKYFIELIAGNAVVVDVMVPAGASSHTYEPTPKQMVAAGKADIWFFLGESFEDKAREALKNHNPKMVFVDLRKNVDLIKTHQCAKHSGCEDLHIWLSPKQAKIQAQTMADTLVKIYPDYKDIFNSNLSIFLQELTDLEQQVGLILKQMPNRTVMVGHPAYAYMARDYNFKQLSVEMEGRDPSPQQLTNILNEARSAKIKKIFTQPQYSNKGAKLIAEEIGAQIVTLDPYSADYLSSLLNIANAFVSP